MTGALRRGLAAGAAGTTALNAVTYLDMAIRGRPASDAPEQTVTAITHRLGHRIPGRGDAQDNRRTSLGALSGIVTGVGVGVGASVVRAVGVRLPAPVGVLATTAAAMAASDVPMAALGVSDPRTWSSQDWVSDVVPHLAYGLATHTVLRLTTPPETTKRPPSRASFSLVLRSAALGVASGSRSSLGVTSPVLSVPQLTGTAVRSLGTVLLSSELVGDKLPSIPNRLEPPSLALRFGSAVIGAAALAKRENATAGMPVLAAAAGAAVGSWGGEAWRTWADSRVADWQAALIEDGVALALAAAACLPRRGAGSAKRRAY